MDVKDSSVGREGSLVSARLHSKRKGIFIFLDEARWDP